MQNKRIIGIMLTAGILLLLPLITIQFTDKVNWTLSDFIVGGVLLFGTGLTCELLLRTVKKTFHRIAACAVVLIALAIVWTELAVGIFGTPIAGI